MDDAAMELQVLSDLHLETPAARPTYSDFHIPAKAKTLALLGDIGSVLNDGYYEFLNDVLKRFECLFYVLGNHEPFETTYYEAKTILRQVAVNIDRRRQDGEVLGKFVFLDQNRYDVLPNLTILGCTLFSAIIPQQHEAVQLFIGDFARIHNWTIDQHNAAHASDVAWLSAQVKIITEAEPQRRIVILSHHSPTLSPLANDPKHLEDLSAVRSAFVTDLSQQLCWTSPAVRLWAFGHTHFNCDYVDAVTGKRVLANQKGYARSEAQGFDAEKVVTVDVEGKTKSRLADNEPRVLNQQGDADHDGQGAKSRGNPCCVVI